ncbi:MAG TPA: glutamate formimidoyltransferase, partial [Chloroflexota bacterium]|nr:glutamate formimidoyltransferase [Chloroflexota bacterium]
SSLNGSMRLMSRVSQAEPGLSSFTNALVECVPNFSEGRRRDVMDAIQVAAESVSAAMVLDRHTDAVHNRMVLTIAGAPGPVAEAAFRATARATELIDLDQHRGVHPRIGATDVVPFVPLGATDMRVCVDLAVRVGRRIAAELDLPVYLYGEAAQTAARRRLPDLRRGEYERLRDNLAANPRLAPDFGPPRVGKAGATAVGARPPLIAYNVTLASSDLGLARDIARRIRESSGGLPAVQARGFATADPNVVQVSMNLLDTRRTSLATVFERIRQAAAEQGVEVRASELVGMAPAEALIDVARQALRFDRLDAEAVLETRLLEQALRVR